MSIVHASDSELVTRSLRGDVEAFNRLVTRWERALFNFAHRLTGHREDAKELCQDAFLKAFDSLRQLKDRERFSSWLFKIALNLFYSKKRSSHDDDAMALDEVGSSHFEAAAGSAHSEGGPRKGIEWFVWQRELERDVKQALRHLPDDQRAAIVLKIYYGMKFEEIADLMDCPVSTAKSRVYAAMELLAGALEKFREG